MERQQEQDQEYLTWIAKLFPEQGHWTEEAFFALPETNYILELSDGHIIMPASPTFYHQKILKTLGFDLSAFVEDNELGEVILAPSDVRLWKGKIRNPDIYFVKTEHFDGIQRDKNTYYGAPDWVAEIVSPGSEKTDREEKLAEYEQAGVPEFWLIDPIPVEHYIKVYVLKDSKYVLVATYRAGEIARSETIPDYQIPVDKVFKW